ncbi:IclR family transcriptional regulator [Ktedonosporobacter rubrisoli]|uniref:Glycerol operon regulatory protein n=1 Tax=Ktedonosporobacter rubrisoli TaxID=2509675 RepID=A0A4V0YYY1_KTERU|nr:IclR family transcriptional regulator [Ktedonosporobacter rubrisoli]QBD77801.1 IclR family transcriptional regulator [Ktedonosporobacter rubrisoli]
MGKLKEVDARNISTQKEGVSPGSVQSVERALELLECLAHSSAWVGISELSHATGQPVGTIHRLLMTLVAREYVVRDNRTRRYALGPAFRRLASTDLQTPDWVKIGNPHLRELVEISGETANLVVKEGNRAVYVAQAQPMRTVRMFTELGNRVFLHCTGCGKVLLAYQPESVIAAIIAETGLPRSTEVTITDPGQLQQELDLIRQRGYALDNGEQEEGVRCLAVPVYSLQGRVVAALSVSGPGSRLDSRRIPGLLPHLKRISASISSVLAASQERGENR